MPAPTMASIEFGILHEWSTLTLDAKFRTSTHEVVFRELEPMFLDISLQTGIEFDMYSDASIEGTALEIFVLQLFKWQQSELSDESREFLSDLRRVASHAMNNGKTLSYFGL
jgi:hypothetical protein